MSEFIIFENTAVAVSIAFVFGTLIGSFLNVLIWRLPREEKPNGRSQCPNCKHELAWRDLIPVVSFAWAGGRCRYCKKPISFRYPVIEIVTGLLFAMATFLLPVSDVVSLLTLLKGLFLIAVCVTVFVIDLEHFLILDKIIFPAMIITLIFLIVIDSLSGTTMNIVYGVVAAAAAFLPFWLIWFLSKGKWMGFGDVKFMALMGLALGFPGIVVAMFLSFMTGALTGVALMVFGKKQLSSKLPFGTFLSFAAIAALIYGQELWQLYWGLFSL